jgi:hypothetical protein
VVDGKPVMRKDWYFGKLHIIKYNSHYESARRYGWVLETSSRFGPPNLDVYTGKNVYVFRMRDYV